MNIIIDYVYIYYTPPLSKPRHRDAAHDHWDILDNGSRMTAG